MFENYSEEERAQVMELKKPLVHIAMTTFWTEDGLHMFNGAALGHSSVAQVEDYIFSSHFIPNPQAIIVH